MRLGVPWFVGGAMKLRRRPGGIAASAAKTRKAVETFH
jgi:hypothetical protein